MTGSPVYVSGLGIISAFGPGLPATIKALRANRSAIGPLQLFSLLQEPPLPVGQIDGLDDCQDSLLPRTHRLARIAADQAMTGCHQPPEAIIVGTTTGGIASTEVLLRKQEENKELYRYHGVNTVAEDLAQMVGCKGPAIAVSTACSSGTVAVALGLALLRRGQVQTVLVGGADALCRLTYFGFNSLQLVDRNGCKPFDENRQGMAVAEGAGMLLLTTIKPDGPCAEILGAGLSCDAYHPATPHPEGQGAYEAMQKALIDAGLRPQDISYINLHGTGTLDNDLAESKAVRRLFPDPPPLSSIKGATGHSLAASGAIEAVVSVMAVTEGLLPANTNLRKVDPQIGLVPLDNPLQFQVRNVLSNSFGFGGNNGSLIVGAPGTSFGHKAIEPIRTLAVHGYSCLTGAGNTAASIERMSRGASAAGMADAQQIAEGLSPPLIRRLKRLPRISLLLAAMARNTSGLDGQTPGAIFMGTGWGALSETHDFLDRLHATQEQFPSPTDFVGSVHNSPASQVAILFGATGPNITTSGGDYSFEQALMAADLLYEDCQSPALILAADEGHGRFSPLLDASIAPGSRLADGGAALCVNRETEGAKCVISLPFYACSEQEDALVALIASLNTSGDWNDKYDLVMLGIPLAMTQQGEAQLHAFQALAKLRAPLVRYRRFTGEFASASAVAAALAISFFETGLVPGEFTGGANVILNKSQSKILILGLGQYITAMELYAATIG